MWWRRVVRWCGTLSRVVEISRVCSGHKGSKDRLEMFSRQQTCVRKAPRID